MQIKKFIAPTLKQASLQMKQELGSDAVILGTRVLYGDNAGGSNRMFELTAGIEEEEKILEYANPEEDNEFSHLENNFSDEIQKLSSKIFINPVSKNTSLSKRDVNLSSPKTTQGMKLISIKN